MNKLLSLLTLVVSGVIVFLIFTDVSDYTAFQPSPTPIPSPSTIPTMKKNWEGYESRKLTIEGKEYNLLVADTAEKQELGLMNVTDLAPYDGMMFIFNEVSPKTFWNKNTLIDLTLLWMNNDVVVGKSELPSITKSGEIVRVDSPGPVNIVVEVPAKK